MAENNGITGFIARWRGVTGRERANYQLFLTELTAALDLPRPEPAEAEDEANAPRSAGAWCAGSARSSSSPRALPSRPRRRSTSERPRKSSPPRPGAPETLTEQVTAVAEVLAAAPGPLTEAQLAAHFKARGPWRRRLANILEMLVTLGRARHEDSHYRAMGDAA